MSSKRDYCRVQLLLWTTSMSSQVRNKFPAKKWMQQPDPLPKSVEVRTSVEHMSNTGYI